MDVDWGQKNMVGLAYPLPRIRAWYLPGQNVVYVIIPSH